ncbi:MAG: DUF5060 domain-containing protein [Aureliella sp.]
MVAVEAEHFVRQSKMDVRAFHLTTSDRTPAVKPDGDPSHIAGASGGAYLEILPDTRRTHADKLTHGVNFAPEAGAMAVLEYHIHFSTPGRYYVWVRAHSTGSEDNGLHVGLDGQWPATGQRMQWCAGKQTWFWESKQRTEKQHCGEPYKIFLDIDKPGIHKVHFSMREDGFEFDKFILTQNREMKRPQGVGPAPQVHSGEKPKTYALVPAPPTPVKKATSAQAATSNATKKELGQGALLMLATAFPTDGTGYYLDGGKWMAINPDKNKKAATSATFSFPTGVYDMTLRCVGENDGSSTYSVNVDDTQVGDYTCPLADEMFAEGPKFHKTFRKVTITEGAIIHVASQIGSKDGKEYSRARWSAVAFTPADEATRTAAVPYLKKQVPARAAPKLVSPTTPVSDKPLIEPRGKDGDGSIAVSGELKQWHKVTLDLSGPYAHEQDNAPNPFTDFALDVTFTHSGGEKISVPGYFAADGDAANSSAESGNIWRVHFAPSKTGKWTYTVSMRRGQLAALNSDAKSEVVELLDGKSGSFTIAASDKSGRDLRAHGQLSYVGKQYLQFAGSGKYFLKAGADAPETLLGYADFDGTVANNPKKVPLKTWSVHVQDWQAGDPTWQSSKGKGMIGAVNYLSGKGCNAFSFLTYNAGGDGDNVWPFIQRNDKMHYDCSKLDQWGIVFDHATTRGMYLHFKLQETEIDDHRRGTDGKEAGVPESLDGGDLGPQRKLYLRELIARFSHNLALNWNLGEENTQTTAQINDMLNYIAEVDPYGHNRVLHTFPGQQDKQYRPLLGDASTLTGLSLQNSGIKDTHSQTAKWAKISREAGKPWVVAFDESGTAAHGQCPDLGYEGYDGRDNTGKMTYTEHDVRHQTLWGTLLGGGAGVEYYFGYRYVQNDLVCEDWRSRDRSWDYCRFAIEFFHDNDLPFVEMLCHDDLVGNEKHDNSVYCLAKPGDTYVVYIPKRQAVELDLGDSAGEFSVQWYNPQSGGSLASGSVETVSGGGKQSLGDAPAAQREGADDWVVLVRKK